MRILITNDDGINAPGIRMLAEWAKTIGEVTVVAPKVEQSGMSHAIQFVEPIEIKRVNLIAGVEAWSMDSTPADGVRFGVLGLERQYDLILSGINRGVNVGVDLVYSGTVAAAMEAIMNGVPAIAFSTANSSSMTIAEKYIVEVAKSIVGKDHNLKEVWNVNFPAGLEGAPRGVIFNRKVAPVWLYDGKYQETVSFDGKRSLMIYGTPMTNPDDAPEGSDLEAVLSGYISIGTVRCSVL